jgi:NAD(P)H-dependent flavin oxidoreductase YrpB (nitropropane dioxygenase family)
MIEVVRLGTPLCQRLGIEHPIFCAGMGAAAGPELAAAVSGAGGLGVLAAAARQKRSGGAPSRRGCRRSGGARRNPSRYSGWPRVSRSGGRLAMNA